MDAVKLDTDQIADLKEVGNIGAGNAASRLSDLIHRRCVIDLPQITYMAAEDIRRILDMEDSYVVMMHIKIMGDIPATMFVLMKRVYAQTIVKYMTRDGLSPSGKDLSFTAQFALKQLGEILTKSFFDSVHQLLMAKAKYAMPEIIMDAWATAQESMLSRFAREGGEHLLVHSAFFDPDKTFLGKFIYAINPESQLIVLNRIKLLLGPKNPTAEAPV
jgi:chemotaxis protein CheC